MADGPIPLTSANDSWQRAVKLFTGYDAPARDTLFESLVGNEGIPQMKVEVTKQGKVTYVDVDDLDWMVENSGWRIENTDFVIPFYATSDDSAAEGDQVSMYKARFTLLGNKSTDGPPVGGVVEGGEFKSQYDDHLGLSGDKATWSTKPLTQYSYGTGRALEALLYQDNGTHGFSWNGKNVSNDQAVTLSSFDTAADSFDRAAQFFVDRSAAIEEWQTRLGVEENDAWRGQAAGVFWNLVHTLGKQYAGYADDLRPAGTVGSKQGTEIRQAKTDFRNAVVELHRRWMDWELYMGNPLRWLHDLLKEIADHVWHHNIRQITYKINSVGSGYSYSTYTTYHTTGAFNQNARRMASGSDDFGPLTELSTWKTVGERAISNWQASVVENLVKPADEALRAIHNSWSTTGFDPGSIRTRSGESLSESYTGDVNEKEKEAAEKAAADAAKQQAEFMQWQKDQAAKAEAAAAAAKAEAERKEAEAKAEAERKEAEYKAEQAAAKAEQERKEAEAKAEQERKEAEAKAEQEAKEAEAKAEQQAAEEKAEQRENEARAEQEHKEAEAKAEQEAAKKEAEAKEAEQLARQEAAQKEAEQKQQEAVARQEAMQLTALNQSKADQERARKDQEAQVAAAEEKAEQKENEARAEQEHKEAEAKAEQEAAKKEAEAKEAEQLARQEAAQKEAEQKQQEAVARQEAAQSEQQARQEAAVAEAEREQAEQQAQQQAQFAEQRERQESVVAEQAARQEEAQRQAEAQYQQARSASEGLLNGGQGVLNGGEGLLNGGDGLSSGTPISGPVYGDGVDLSSLGDGRTTVGPDGRVVTDYPDGSKVTIDPATHAATVTLPDGSSVSGPLNAGDLLTNPDGSVTHLDDLGRVVTEYPDGGTSVIDPDTGLTTYTAPDGSTTSGYLNGTGPAGTSYGTGSPYDTPSYEEELYDDTPYESSRPSTTGGIGYADVAAAAALNGSTPLNTGTIPGSVLSDSDLASSQGGSPAGGMPMGGMPMGGGGGQGGQSSERVRNVIDGGQTGGRPSRTGRGARTAAGRQLEEADITLPGATRPTATTGSSPYPMQGGAGGPGQTQTQSGDRLRDAWVQEEEDVWGTDEGGAPAVIGR
ncbi:AAWKG family protein [uncultured Streptomyces sp.]|uniref:AAWKG family protein n=1 Tax=uncultured Streptomyces sp. TaxID=174707 RepID=UPI00261A5CB4|nr:AAWKG family protein [uncultured Streptomyces sp.]